MRVRSKRPTRQLKILEFIQKYKKVIIKLMQYLVTLQYLGCFFFFRHPFPVLKTYHTDEPGTTGNNAGGGGAGGGCTRVRFTESSIKQEEGVRCGGAGAGS